MMVNLSHLAAGFASDFMVTLKSPLAFSGSGRTTVKYGDPSYLTFELGNTQPQPTDCHGMLTATDVEISNCSPSFFCQFLSGDKTSMLTDISGSLMCQYFSQLQMLQHLSCDNEHCLIQEHFPLGTVPLNYSSPAGTMKLSNIELQKVSWKAMDVETKVTPSPQLWVSFTDMVIPVQFNYSFQTFLGAYEGLSTATLATNGTMSVANNVVSDCTVTTHIITFSFPSSSTLPLAIKQILENILGTMLQQTACLAASTTITQYFDCT
eukprot:NODE_3291_length_950_cov_7.207547_g2737_i0.p1 GENE.NODE_3291_length_950_cov_7.207547_g2737_i0~~NODE_3291_length_950_cov_7.207547_g2737_i0.p1  ORF type:complete len:290 (-),score=106.81 NODE_3291_length_950_cov_7.207547_g2737_i0:79-873(-)